MAKKNRKKRKFKATMPSPARYRHYRPKKRRLTLLDSPFIIPDDKRFFKPTIDPLTTDLTPERYVEKKPTKQPGKKKPRRIWLSFAVPRKSPVCIRRKARREHLFRTRKIGRGKKVSSIRRRNYNSDISCN